MFNCRSISSADKSPAVPRSIVSEQDIHRRGNKLHWLLLRLSGTVSAADHQRWSSLLCGADIRQQAGRARDHQLIVARCRVYVNESQGPRWNIGELVVNFRVRQPQMAIHGADKLKRFYVGFFFFYTQIIVQKSPKIFFGRCEFLHIYISNFSKYLHFIQHPICSWHIIIYFWELAVKKTS